MFSISRKQLINLCQAMGTMLEAGLPVTRALAVLEGQEAPGRLRRALHNAAERLGAGSSLAEAFEQEGAFPPLFLQLVAAGEESGTLARTFHELRRFYEFRQRTWRRFLSRIMVPALQYVLAVLIVAGASHVQAMIGDAPSPALGVLLVGYGAPLALIGAYWFLVNVVGGMRLTHELVLLTPVLGGVMRQIALARFSLVMHLLYEAGVPLTMTLSRAFEATGNGAFQARAQGAVAALKEGATITEALAGTGLFPRQYTDILTVAEESGKVSERLDWLARHHEEEAERALTALAVVVSWVIWAAVAGVIIYFIFRMFMGYVGAFEEAGLPA